MNLCFLNLKNIQFEGGLIECGQELRFCIRLILPLLESSYPMYFTVSLTT